MRQSPQSHSRIPSPWAALLSWKKTTCPWPAAVHEQNPSSYEAWSEKCPDTTTHSRYWWQLPNSHMASQGEVETRLRNSSRIHNQQWTARAALPLCQHHDVWRHSGQNLSCLASSQLAVGLLSPALCQARATELPQQLPPSIAGGPQDSSELMKPPSQLESAGIWHGLPGGRGKKKACCFTLSTQSSFLY